MKNTLLIIALLASVATFWQMKTEVTLRLEGWAIELWAPESISFPDVVASNVPQEVGYALTDDNYFWIEDLKSTLSWYHTTLQIKEFKLPDNSSELVWVKMRLVSTWLTVLGGVLQSGLDLASWRDVYSDFSSPVTLFGRYQDTDWIVWKYWVQPEFKLEVPPYQKIWDYEAIMVYTLIEH